MDGLLVCFGGVDYILCRLYNIFCLCIELIMIFFAGKYRGLNVGSHCIYLYMPSTIAILNLPTPILPYPIVKTNYKVHYSTTTYQRNLVNPKFPIPLPRYPSLASQRAYIYDISLLDS